MATLTISFNGLSRSWTVSGADQARILNAMKATYTVDGEEPTNAQAFEIATDGFVNSLINIAASVENAEAAATAIAAITPVVFTEQ